MKIAQIGQRSKKLGHGVKIIGRRIIKLVRIFKKNSFPFMILIS